MRIKVKQMILIIVVSAVVYLVVGAMAPFIKYKEVSSQAGDSSGRKTSAAGKRAWTGP